MATEPESVITPLSTSTLIVVFRKIVFRREQGAGLGPQPPVVYARANRAPESSGFFGPRVLVAFVLFSRHIGVHIHIVISGLTPNRHRDTDKLFPIVNCWRVG